MARGNGWTWAAAISGFANVLQAQALQRMGQAKREAEVRLEGALADIDELKRQVTRGEADLHAERRARNAAETTTRQVKADLEGERAEHQNAKAALAKARTEIETLKAERAAAITSTKQETTNVGAPLNS